MNDKLFFHNNILINQNIKISSKTNPIMVENPLEPREAGKTRRTDRFFNTD